jgi:4-hydroxy-tetrahydrodipicolinate reductase
MSGRVLLIGYGRMGRAVESLLPEYGVELAGVVDRVRSERSSDWPDADVAVDFSTPDAVPRNLPRLASRGVNVVIGTTAWQAHEAAMRSDPAVSRIGVIAAPNFALGVNVFIALAERAAALLAPHDSFGAWIHEAHHATKRDKPSGTTLALKAAFDRAGYQRPVDITSTRAGSIPGTHTVGFDAAAETLTFTHTARDRSVFARGALEAARWVMGRQGWFTMKDVLGL